MHWQKQRHNVFLLFFILAFFIFTGTMCATKADKHAWIAVDYGKKVNVKIVELINRESCCWSRTQNVDVRISDQVQLIYKNIYKYIKNIYSIPASHFWWSDVFWRLPPWPLCWTWHKGRTHLHLRSKAAVKSLLLINIPGKKLHGRYVIVQMNNGGQPLNLQEVKAFGRATSP